MYTATIQSKEKHINGIKINVTFTDDVTKESFVESCIPSDLDGFKFWVKSRLDQLNAAPMLDNLFQKDDVIEVHEQPTEVVLTPEEVAANVWIAKYRRYVRIKHELIDTGIILATQPKVAALLTDIKNTIKPEYIDLI